jgi:tRNA threonylcarbamoyladenosine biosynthesis protein TsaE
MKTITTTLTDIPELSKKIAQKLKGGEVLALVGPLGSGKTTFTKALGKFLKVKNTVTSPTFVLMSTFLAKLKNNKKVYLYHLDLYRTKNFREVEALGITEFWGKKDTLTVIEWANKIQKHLPKNTTVIKFK